MKRKQISYNERGEILADIDRHRGIQNEYLIKSAEADVAADFQKEWLARNPWSDQWSDAKKRDWNAAARELKDKRELARKLEKKANGKERRCDRLKRTLAAFDTQPMPFSEGAVVLQQ